MRVVEDVAALYNVTVEDMNGKSRRDAVCTAREMCWLYLYEELEIHTEDIGIMFNRHRTTIIWGINRMRNLIAFHRETREKWSWVRRSGISIFPYLSQVSLV